MLRALDIANGPRTPSGRDVIVAHNGVSSGTIGSRALVMVGLALGFILAARLVLDRRTR